MDINALVAQEEELRSRLQMIERQLDMLMGMREDKQRALSTLKGLKDAEPGTEILLPVGGTTFVRAALGDNSTVLKGIGAGYAMPRQLDTAVEELKAEAETIERDVQKTSQAASEIEARHAQIVQVLQGAGAEPMSAEAANQ